MGLSIYWVFDILYACCCLLLFSFFAEKRGRISRFILFVAVAALGGTYFAIGEIFYDFFYIKAILVVGITAAVMLLLFRIRCAKAVVLSMFFYGAQLTAEYLVIVLMGKLIWLITGRPFELSDVFTFSVVCIVNKILLLGVVLGIGKGLGEKSRGVLTRKEWWSLFVVSFITIYLIIALVLRTDVIYSTNPDRSHVYIAIGIPVINFIICYLIYSVMKKEVQLREHIIFRDKLKSETAMYRSISENLERQQKRTHEYKNQIAAIRALAADGKLSELNTYLEKIDNNLQLRTNAVDTNHVIVNAILNTKYREAVEQGTVFVLKVNDLSKLKMEDEDIVTILSNLLSNALEACGKCKGKERIVKLKFVLENGQCVISVKNSMEVKPVMEDGRFLTSKGEEAGEHGIGVRNIVEVIEKYNGRYVIDYDGEFFQMVILIPD
ncbi:MAG: GHKL domain-containing protein [Muribaculaceae bacterium]|nr:GHKL domain-containing protein [Roseburia sp.]MCM1431328.1 GHKL domain-containing protein [Muribaculaceae bacterium]MCM1491770.1 GHKL domain-containing protein [Muribaculaceae bacterium]